MSDDKPRIWAPSAPPAAQGAEDRRLFAPATLRNRDAILAVLQDTLQDTLPRDGVVVEIASGSGEHVVHFAAAMPALTFQPTDPSPDALASIAAWTRDSGLANIRPPLLLDATEPDWPIAAADALLCINMVHIAPWAAAQGLVRQAGAILPASAPLYLYGPYRRAGRPLEPGNAAFDASLRERNPEWGLREVDAVAALAQAAGFGPPDIVEMPANNLSLVFRKTSAG